MSFQIRNKFTGDIVEIDTSPESQSLHRFQRVCLGLDRKREQQGLCLFFLTLTVRDENVSAMNKDLHKFTSWMGARFRRAGSPWFYVWVVELQRKRYSQYGIVAPHWHFAIVCPFGALPDVVEKTNRGKPKKIVEGSLVTFADLEKFWGQGFVWSVVAKSPRVYGYLSKYFEKDYSKMSNYNPDWENMRRFGSSHLSYFAFPKWGYDWVLEQIKELGDGFYIRKVGSSVGFYAKGETEKINFNDDLIKSSEFVCVREERSPWKLVRGGESESNETLTSS